MPTEETIVQSAGQQDLIKAQDASGSVRKRAERTNVKLVSVAAAFSIPLTHLPIADQIIDHDGSFPTLPWVFSSLFANVFHSFCQTPNIEELRQKFAKEIDAADTVWRTQSEQSLINWVDYTAHNHDRVHDVVHLLVGSMLTSPRQILHVLNMLKPLDQDFAVRANCLYLTGFLYKSQLSQDKHLLQLFDAEVDRLRLVRKWPATQMNLDHIRMLMWRSDEAQRVSFMSSLRQRYPIMSTWNLLYLTMHCATNGLPDEASAFLNTIQPHLLQKPSTLVLKCCAQLLQHDYVVHTAAGPNFRYLPPLLEKGLAPDSRLYHRIIERALESDYAGVAWDIFHHLQTLDIAIFWRTYHILLRQAFNSRNVKGVDEIMSQIHQRPDLYSNPIILIYAMNMVRRINHSSKKMGVLQGLSHILALYDRVYSRAPLVIFGITTSNEHTAPENEGKGTKHPLAIPDAPVLSFTVWSFILCHKHGRSIQWLWERIQLLVDDRNKTAYDCMKRDLIYNAFIWLHLKHEETIPDALKVFQYMLQKQLCLPTARTWSIVICGFLKLGQRTQARQMYDLMVKHGFTIDHICQEYTSKHMTLEDLEQRVDEVLDDQNMLEGTDLHWVEDLESLSGSGSEATEAVMPELSDGSGLEPGSLLHDIGPTELFEEALGRSFAAQ